MLVKETMKILNTTMMKFKDNSLLKNMASTQMILIKLNLNL
jgi:hypothetical protein